ncbi:pyridoxine kinase/hydroxymethylpyrimidine/phosphomethylpyrimidine kinase [Ureibacillus xyleni]|uniref:pyridoxal kinase n=1 Tax=Ureibacillus xyleni TaxID=614648 RepID=A0A285RBI8_9BACL|nr:bifunctional hydroxymethylpyrimidine kinase/phosphomethylpyrimidine kinase [Ureibacillus xyleni]SOB91473.1 pyridoxine kinase/hydroxymethylpyrimidine/phosphomethylpyrimidine kinase [Ureibacillus xyleni]
MTISKACTIAGSAARGGAGIQADLKTFQELGVFGMSAITAFVAAHPETKQGIFIQPLDVIEAQLSTIYEQGDIEALKTGMLFSKEIIGFVADWLQSTAIQNIVVDPVMFGKAGSALLDFDAMDTLKTTLIPQAKIITPNMPEASFLLGGAEISSLAHLQEAARALFELDPEYILVKGGRLQDAAIDVLYDGNTMTLLEAPRIETVHTNGAGCSYSAAITAGLANGLSMKESVIQAKKFVTAGIRRSIPFEKVAGMIDHRAFKLYGEEAVKVL